MDEEVAGIYVPVPLPFLDLPMELNPSFRHSLLRTTGRAHPKTAKLAGVVPADLKSELCGTRARIPFYG